jgi:hypothetical protein
MSQPQPILRLITCPGAPFDGARLLEINPHTLRARMRKLGIDRRRFSPANDE